MREWMTGRVKFRNRDREAILHTSPEAPRCVCVYLSTRDLCLSENAEKASGESGDLRLSGIRKS